MNNHQLLLLLGIISLFFSSISGDPQEGNPETHDELAGNPETHGELAAEPRRLNVHRSDHGHSTNVSHRVPHGETQPIVINNVVNVNGPHPQNHTRSNSRNTTHIHEHKPHNHTSHHHDHKRNHTSHHIHHDNKPRNRTSHHNVDHGDDNKEHEHTSPPPESEEAVPSGHQDNKQTHHPDQDHNKEDHPDQDHNKEDHPDQDHNKEDHPDPDHNKEDHTRPYSEHDNKNQHHSVHHTGQNSNEHTHHNLGHNISNQISGDSIQTGVFPSRGNEVFENCPTELISTLITLAGAAKPKNKLLNDPLNGIFLESFKKGRYTSNGECSCEHTPISHYSPLNPLQLPEILPYLQSNFTIGGGPQAQVALLDRLLQPLRGRLVSRGGRLEIVSHENRQGLSELLARLLSKVDSAENLVVLTDQYQKFKKDELHREILKTVGTEYWRTLITKLLVGTTLSAESLKATKESIANPLKAPLIKVSSLSDKSILVPFLVSSLWKSFGKTDAIRAIATKANIDEDIMSLLLRRLSNAENYFIRGEYPIRTSRTKHIYYPVALKKKDPTKHLQDILSLFSGDRVVLHRPWKNIDPLKVLKKLLLSPPGMIGLGISNQIGDLINPVQAVGSIGASAFSLILSIMKTRVASIKAAILGNAFGIVLDLNAFQAIIQIAKKAIKGVMVRTISIPIVTVDVGDTVRCIFSVIDVKFKPFSFLKGYLNKLKDELEGKVTRPDGGIINRVNACFIV